MTLETEMPIVNSYRDLLKLFKQKSEQLKKIIGDSDFLKNLLLSHALFDQLVNLHLESIIVENEVLEIGKLFPLLDQKKNFKISIKVPDELLEDWKKEYNVDIAKLNKTLPIIHEMRTLLLALFSKSKTYYFIKNSYAHPKDQILFSQFFNH